jgi:uncharacterized protein (TIGR03083 family)
MDGQMDVETQWSHVESERRSLALLLAGLTPDQWEQRSLCTQWRVRDVAAHVTMTPAGDPGLWEMVSGLVRARGDLWGFGRDVAIAWAERPTSEIVDTLRDRAASRRMPVVTNAQNMLLDVIVHGQDIAVPLGIARPVPESAGLAAFERIWTMGWPFHARKRLAGLTLVATDADLEVGTGPRVEGPLSVLLLLVTGRTTAARERLRGPGLERVPA